MERRGNKMTKPYAHKFNDYICILEQRRSKRILRAERLSKELSKDCSQKFFAHVNRNKRLAARILQLRHPSGSLISSDQEMAELLKTAFLGFFRED